MHKLSLFVATLVVIAVLGISVYAKNTKSKAKPMTANGTITAVNATADTINLKKVNATTETTFSVHEK